MAFVSLLAKVLLPLQVEPEIPIANDTACGSIQLNSRHACHSAAHTCCAGTAAEPREGLCSTSASSAAPQIPGVGSGAGPDSS